MSKTLLVVTTYNLSEYTKACFDSLKNIEDDIDILIIDDCSTDDTIELCEQYGHEVITKDKGMGLTDSWNRAFVEFKNRWFVNDVGMDDNYDYLILSNNDVLVPKGAVTEIKKTFSKWPFSLIVPMSTEYGAGHNRQQGIEYYYPKFGFDWEDPHNYQSTQNSIMKTRDELSNANNLFKLDPIRMKMFNGFFFMMNRDIINYQYSNTQLFDPKNVVTKNEDEFNWSKLIPNDDFSALCKTSFVYHYKGVTLKGDLRNNDTWKKARFGDG